MDQHELPLNDAEEIYDHAIQSFGQHDELKNQRSRSSTRNWWSRSPAPKSNEATPQVKPLPRPTTMKPLSRTKQQWRNARVTALPPLHEDEAAPTPKIDVAALPRQMERESRC